MKDYNINGLSLLNELGTTHFNIPVLLGEYKLMDWGGHEGFERIKLNKLIKGSSTKKGSFVYVYVLNKSQVVYIGQTVITSRIFTPSSIGGFNKQTGDVLIPSTKHGKRNVSTFFQVFDLLKQGNTLEVYLIEAKENNKIVTEFGDELEVIIKPQNMEKLLQDKYKAIHNTLPMMHELHEQSYNY